ncbi:MAG: hypothetical protein H5T69_11895 [Chloroflexi bacterium]|nr:hypothetical protein [Chloroflexota bacterium]
MSTPSLENDLLRLELSAQSGAWMLLDKRADVRWGNVHQPEPWVYLRHGGEAIPLTLASVEEIEAGLSCRFVDTTGAVQPLRLVFRLTEDALLAYIVPDENSPFSAVELFTSGLAADATEGGDALAPVRMGLLLPAWGDEPCELHLDTYAYEGTHMAMAGLFKAGAALMLTWGDPYITLNLSRHTKGVPAPLVCMSLTLAKTARSLALYPLGPGDLTTLARAYRRRVEALGYCETWAEKLLTRPQAVALFGACNFKLWHALARRIDENLVEQSVTVRWTFDEVARIAEHLKYDLELDDVLFHLGGWTRYGYDVRHPDIWPPNPECGGLEGLIDCARRVQACGYLFCLHDNYQDMYRDSPSWDEAWLEKDADGSPHKGGVWLGGQAYYTCAREALKLAQREENLPAVRDAIAPDLYFIDTTYAVGPQECYDPRHPLTRQEDIAWKIALSDYARNLFGLFGSECGREWAVPHADFFEGLASVSGRYYHRLDPGALGARTVPFFDMVFGDCIAIYGKYGYKPAEMAEQVIHHVAMGRPLYYHSVGDHLYWQDEVGRAELPFPDGDVDPAAFTRAHNGWAEGMHLWDRFIKNTQEVLGPLNKRVAMVLIERYEFLDNERLVRRTTFANGVIAIVNGSCRRVQVSTRLGGKVTLPPYGFVVEAPTFVAFYALSWGGMSFEGPALFTLTSLDDKPLSNSRQVRVFHGSGDARLPWRGGRVEVRRQAIL